MYYFHGRIPLPLEASTKDLKMAEVSVQRKCYDVTGPLPPNSGVRNGILTGPSWEEADWSTGGLTALQKAVPLHSAT